MIGRCRAVGNRQGYRRLSRVWGIIQMAANLNGLPGPQRFPEFGFVDALQLQRRLPGGLQHDMGHLDLGESRQQGVPGKVALKSDKLRWKAKRWTAIRSFSHANAWTAAALIACFKGIGDVMSL